VFVPRKSFYPSLLFVGKARRRKGASLGLALAVPKHYSRLERLAVPQHYSRLERHAKDKLSNLLQIFMNYSIKSLGTLGPERLMRTPDMVRSQHTVPKICGSYYKQITITYDASRIIRMTIVSDAKHYDCN
jgi:hypothetical protein